MSEMIEVKTADLIGPALDWAVGIAEGWESDRPQDGQLRKAWLGCTQYVLVGRDAPCVDGHRYSPSTDWSQGGPLIEKYSVRVIKHSNPDWSGGYWRADVGSRYLGLPCATIPLIAICRAVVAAKLGEIVQVPSELLEGKAL